MNSITEELYRNFENFVGEDDLDFYIEDFYKRLRRASKLGKLSMRLKYESEEIAQYVMLYVNSQDTDGIFNMGIEPIGQGNVCLTVTWESCIFVANESTACDSCDEEQYD